MSKRESNRDHFNEILKSYFSKKQIAEFVENYLFKSHPSFKTKDKEAKKQIEYDFRIGADNRKRIDLLITFAELKLSKNKFLNLLTYLGQLTIVSGEFAIADEIHRKIILITESDLSLNNITANAYLSLADIYSRQAQWKFSINYIHTAERLFKLLNDNKGLAACANLIGTIFGDQGNLKRATESFEKSLYHLGKNQDPALTGKIEINLGILHNIQGDPDKAISYFKRALFNFERIGDKRRIAEIRQNLGMAFIKKKDYNSAARELDQSISTSIEIKNLPTTAVAYISKALTFFHQYDFQLADAYTDKALEISYQLNDKLSIAEVYKVKGMIQRTFRKYLSAENFLLTSLRLNHDLENKLNEAETCVELGILYRDTNRRKESRSYLLKARKYYSSIKAKPEVDKIDQMLE